MILTWRHITELFIIIITFGRTVLALESGPKSNPRDWRVIESLAEEHPYLVALLSGTRDYICTGSIITKRTILTSGSCVSYNPKYVLTSAAIYNKDFNNRTLFEIAGTKLHQDYIFDLKTSDPNVTRMHSNIGLVFMTRPVLELFVSPADMGNYYASELKEKKLVAVGFGRLGSSDMVALQQQAYHQTPCTNPRWYYCVCGIEYSTYTRTYTYEFGTGAPVMYGSEVVAITATPCGTLTMKNLGIKYNIFTVIGPYIPWIDKSQMNTTVVVQMQNDIGNDLKPCLLFYYFYILLVISKAFL